MIDLTCKIELQMPNQASLFDQVKANAKYATDVLTADSAIGKSVVICGAGPSLNDHLDSILLSDEVWACNSALPYLKDRHVRVTHGFAIDQGEAMLGAVEWERTFDVTYLIASSVHPSLVTHLRTNKRKTRFFHSFLGIADPEGEKDYELKLYTSLYPTSLLVGHGLNAVPRALCLALAMGFSRITVYGADCACKPGCSVMPFPEEHNAEYNAWLDTVQLYADGRTAAVYGSDACMAEAEIDGRLWHTRPDMLISAQHLLALEAGFPGRVTLIGDTLPNAIRGKDMTGMPELSGMGEVSGFYTGLEAA